MSEAKFDSHRRLCPDGTCIGVIGDDGRCRVCGRSAGGGGKDAATAAPATGDAVEGEMDGGSHGADADAGTSDADDAKAAAAAGFDPNRRLCPDGNCIGVIGADGVCTVCGQKAD